MSVVNSELKRIRHFQLNGVITINPGLNQVTDEQLRLLEGSKRFKKHCDRSEMNVVTHQKNGMTVSPETVADLDITSVNVKNGRVAIQSCTDTKVLEAWQRQETDEDGGGRKGILEAIEEQLEELKRMVDKVAAAAKEN